MNDTLVVLGMMFTMYFIYAVLLVLYIITLIKQAKRSEWVWFVATLLVSPAMLVYWIYRLVKKK